MSDCIHCIAWQVRHQISHIQELERELDNLKGREQTYLLAAEVKAKLEEVKMKLRKMKT
jgi:hypothetical protein